MTTYKRNGQPISHIQMVNACALAGITPHSEESYYQAIQRLAAEGNANALRLKQLITI